MPSATTSDYLYKARNDNLFGLTGTAPPTPTNFYVALFVGGVPDLDGNLSVGVTEVGTGVNYNRIAVPADNLNWQLVGLDYSNILDITFGTPSGDWGLIAGAGLYDDPTAGNLLFTAPLSTSKQVSSGDGAPKILAGQLIISRAVCP
jgi:hypothetical protein